MNSIVRILVSSSISPFRDYIPLSREEPSRNENLYLRLYLLVNLLLARHTWP